MVRILLWSLFLTAFSASAQQRVMPIASGFKDAAFATGQFDGPSIFPIAESDAQVYQLLQDTVKRYSSVGYFLYQRQLIEIRDKKAKLWITPLLNMAYGAELRGDTTMKRYQNTRGARLEGTLGKRIFFTTSFYENQAILPDYVSAYVQQRGEQYFNATDSTYSTQNAVIPGAARTKPFKTNGYDYAFATGMVSFFATPKLTIHWGNQQLFVGSGHRSLLWSDNGVGLMNLRVRYRFNAKWDLQCVRARGLNLIRRPVATNGEAYYEPKSLSFATLYFQPVKTVSIGLFEGGTWDRGDAVSQKSIPLTYFIPLPGAATLQESIDRSSAFTIVGLDAKWRIARHLLYGQFALHPFSGNQLAWQLGARIFPTANPFFQLQLEYNHADQTAYTATNPRLNYGNYNLPLAHPMGAGFDEVLLRVSWEKNHWFAALQTNVYFNQSQNGTLLMPLLKSAITLSQQVFNQQIEAGYRFNRTYGFDLFGSFRYRYANGSIAGSESILVSLGIRTLLTNTYFDF